MQSTARPLVLVDAVVPAYWTRSRAGRIVTDLALMVGFAWFVALCAQIVVRVPWTTVPITGQTFAVLVAGGALGAWRGGGSMLIYFLLGMVGVPVFAPGSALASGTWGAHFVLPWQGTAGYPWDLSSGGYLVGFILAAAITGYCAQLAWDRKPWITLGMLLAQLAIYIPGLLWLYYLIASGWVHPVGEPLAQLIPGSSDLEKTLNGGLYPFVVGDLMKLYLAGMVLPAGWAFVNWFRGSKRHDR
jgi:biotin transport system substrate-specific component